MKLVKYILFLFLAIGNTTLFAAKSNQHTLDKIVAVVNENVITQLELDKQIKKFKLENNDTANQIPREALEKQLLNQMIMNKLQLDMANLNGISATTEQVNAALENMAAQNNLDIFQFKKMIENEGIDIDDFKRDLKEQLTIMSVQQAAANSDITISEQEIKQAMELMESTNTNNKYKVSQILLSVPDEPSSEKIKFAKDKANKIVKDLKNGADFEKVAKLTSDGQQALNGGDMGWFNVTELPTLFSDIIPNLNKGEVYGPIQSESGFHILKLTDVKLDDNKYVELNYKVRHILIKKDNITTSKIAEMELKKLKREIEVNNNFEELALIYSDDHGSASNGGDIGWVNRHLVVPEFAAVMESLKKNEISMPFETSYGWHIAQLIDKKTVDNTEKWKRNKARQIITEKKFQDALVAWQNKLRTQAHIKTYI